MDYYERQKAVLRRARAVLGVDEDACGDRLRHAWHCRMIEHHPDRSSEPDAQRMAALVNEAFHLLNGRERRPHLLLDEALAARVAGVPLDEIQGAPSYEEWLKERFLNVREKSIWAY